MPELSLIKSRILKILEGFLGSTIDYSAITTERNYLFLIHSDYAQSYAFLEVLEREFDISFTQKDLTMDFFFDFEIIVGRIYAHLHGSHR